MGLIFLPEVEDDDCHRCMGRRLVPDVCSDAKRYAKQGVACTVNHQKTCPKCHGTGKSALYGKDTR